MKGTAITIGIVVLLVIQLAAMYIAAPIILVTVLAAFGIKVSFWVCLGACWLLYFVVGMLKR